VMLTGKPPWEIAASRASGLVAAAVDDGFIQVWDIDLGVKRDAVPAVYSFGGRRIAIDRSGSICITGAWHVGVAGYSMETNKCLWTNTTLREVQYVKSSSWSDSVFVITAAGVMCTLNTHTGQITERKTGINNAFESPIDHSLLIFSKKSEYRVLSKYSYNIQRCSFGIIEAAFGPSTFVIREAGLTPIRAFDLFSGIELARSRPVDTVRGLYYSERTRYFYAMHSIGERLAISRFSSDLEFDEIGQIRGTFAFTVCPARDALVTSEGEVYDVTTCEKLLEMK
jgi:hypothetical protein